MRLRAIATMYLNEGVRPEDVHRWLDRNIPDHLKSKVSKTYAATETPDGRILHTITTVLDGIPFLDYPSKLELKARDESFRKYGVIRRMIDVTPVDRGNWGEIPLPECVFWQINTQHPEMNHGPS